MNLQKLYARGWTAAQAARHFGVVTSTVTRALNGKRKNPQMLAALESLPQRTLIFRPARTNKQTTINVH